MPTLRPLVTGITLLMSLLCSLPGQQTRQGERLPAAAISPLLLETMDVVRERQRTMQLPKQELPIWNGQDGRWFVPGDSAKTPAHSGLIAIVNEWGDPRMAIGFPQPVDVSEVWAAGHGAAPARALRVLGYRDGKEVARTSWIGLHSQQQQLLPLAFTGVDRLEFEAAPTLTSMAFLALDDLKFAPAGQPQAARTLDFEDLAHKTILDGSNYAGLSWLRGNGFKVPIKDLDQVPAPRTEPEADDTAGTPPGSSLLTTLTATSPRTWNDFIGVTQGDPGANLIPPDTCGATGPDHYVVIVNANLSAFQKGTGARVLNVGLNAFWNVTGLIGDPRCVFDPHTQRFVAMAENFNVGMTFFYAISQTTDPAGAWFKFSFRTDNGIDVGRWPDYATLGVDARGIYSATYMVGTPAQMTLFAIDKAPLFAPTPALGTVTAFRGLPYEGAIQPCTTYGDPGREYLVSRPSGTGLRLRYVAPPLTAPTLIEAGIVTVPANSAPPNAPALGSTTPISTIDGRPLNAVFRNGSVWTAHGVSFNTRAACRWYQLGTAPAGLLQSGTLADTLWNYYFATVSVDADGNVGLGFSGSHAAVYCSTFVTGRRASDPAGLTAAPILVKAGEAAWNRLDSAGRNRFGDYSIIDVDPVDDRGFWTNQEYIAPVANSWRTRITRFGFEAAEYGVGLSGTSSVPTLRTVGRPVIGQTLVFELGSSGGASPAPGVLLLGFQTASTPAFGGTVLVTPLLNLPVPIPAPFASVPVPIPGDPNLVGLPVYFQAAQLDTGAVQLVAFSRGLEVRCGTR